MIKLESGLKRYLMKVTAEWWEPESDQAPAPKSLYIQQRAILRELFNPSKKTILDAGTGKGRFAIDFALNGARRVFAVDISNEMLRVAKERTVTANVAKKIYFHLGDVENLAFDGDSFDITCCMETFVHLVNPQKAMKELARVTKHGGIVIANATLPGRILRTRYRWGRSFKGLILPVLRVIYWSRICEPIRPLLHEKLGLPLSLDTFKKPRHISKSIPKPKRTFRHIPKQEFISLFQSAELEVVKMVVQGPWHSPVFLIVAARKPNKNSRSK